ncbi:hypothetical protein EDD18DRAFT_1113309 [Armillaria luteobubalina]|uniref:Uncharacterized protein n=1 Tax=Armillaria luteobubalina TaxID=153913 RepID=A0AA39PB97_9AGAR|nr:hypothetical protein EDD18DRAFT_1113309 [Armillaria luteobubalina]
MTPPIPSLQSYLESLDSAQLAELILALEQCGVVLAPATLPTASGPTHSAMHSSSLSGAAATPSLANVATSVATVPETNGWNAVAPLVLDVDHTVYISHPTHMAASAHYANAMANNEVKILLTDDEDDA